MTLFWNIFYWLIPIWTFVMIPFSTFYYEADDGMLMAGTSVGANAKPNSRICEAVKYQILVLIIVGLFFGLTFLFLNETAIPVREYYYNATDGLGAEYQITPIYNVSNETQDVAFSSAQLANVTQQDRDVVADNWENPQMGELVLQVSVSTFFAGLMAWLGWFFFALFGGVGIASMPLDLILRFVNRPRHMDAVEFADAEMSIRERVNELVDIGELIKIDRDDKEDNGGGGGWFKMKSRDERKEAKEEKKTLLQFKQAVYLLEGDVDDFKNCSSNYQNYNPLIPYFALILGVIAFIVSIFWVLHIILYVIPKSTSGNPVTPFLNSYFMWFDRWFPLFGVLSVAIFTVYLMLAALKGCFKFGLRFLFFTLHPMKVNGTYMSSFLFNTGLVLLCALPIVQFCVIAFDDYARYATVNQVFGTQIMYLRFFKYFWENNVFVYMLLAFSVLTAIYLGCKPRDTSSDSIELRDRLQNRRA